MTPWQSWLLIAGLTALATIAYAVAVWVEDSDDRRWREDAERWEKAHKALATRDLPLIGDAVVTLTREELEAAALDTGHPWPAVDEPEDEK